MKKLMALYCFVLMVYSCAIDPSLDSRDIEFINRSSEVVYCLPSQTDSIRNPHTSLDDIAMDELYKTPIDSSILMRNKPLSWDDYIKNCKGGRMRFFIIPKDSIDKYDWQVILNHNIYTKVYKVTIDDLNSWNWKIVYDGKR